MIAVEQVGDADRSAWNEFVAGMESAEPYHPYEWRGVFERVYGHRCLYLAARNSDGRIVGILPLVQLKSTLFGNFLVSVPNFSYAGILAESIEGYEALAASAWSTAQAVGARHVELRHRSGIELKLPYREDKVAMCLSLPASNEELWKGFSSKLRAQIRRPGKEGATCEHGGVELLDDFYRVFSRNMRDLGTPVFPKALFREMFESFPETTRAFVVTLDGEPCAAGITYGFRDRLEIPSASSLRDYNRVSVNMLLYSTALQYAIENGYRVFDFGRSTPDTGTYRFKKQWGAVPEQLRWHYCLEDGAEIPKLNPQNPKFELAARIWQRLPVPVANLIGPKIVRNLP